MARKKFLFSEKDLSAIVREIPNRIRSTVEALPEDAFGANAEQATADLIEQFRRPRLELEPDRVEIATQSTAVDVSHEWFIRGADRGERIEVPGTRVSYHVPFRGDRGLFDCRGNTYTLNPPEARVAANELIFDYDVPTGQGVGQTKAQYTKDLADVLQWVGWVNELVDEFMRSLPGIVGTAFSARAQRLRRATDELAALGLPIRKAAEARTESLTERTKSPSKKRRPPPVRDYDVALSFAGEDRDYVNKVVGVLKTKKLSFFYDDLEKVNLWGRDLGPHLAEIYGKRSRFVVIFISRHYAEKVWPRWEWKNALAGAITMKSDRVLPARFDDTVLEGLLPTIGHVDLRDIAPETLADMIAEKLRGATEERTDDAGVSSTAAERKPSLSKRLGNLWVGLDYPQRVGLNCGELAWEPDTDVPALIHGEGYELVIRPDEVGEPCRVRCHAGPDMTLLRKPKANR